MERSSADLDVGGADHSLAKGRDHGRNGPVASELMPPGEVAELFGVDPKTVSRWADAGKLDALRTLGGHRRYRAEEVHALLEQAATD